jgi:glycosyltransferase involved in cell wall biosynthesis
MKICYVVVAYGHEVFGGAETHCRMMATRMAKRGHDVTVATSCATTYYDWANHYEPGTSELDGVTVQRFAVKAPRDHRRFGPLSNRVLSGHRPVPLFMQERWMRLQGPYLPELLDWLWDNATDFDVVVFFAYNYSPVVDGLRRVSGRVPTVMHPLAHDEPPLYLPLYDSVFHLPSTFAFSVEEEAQLVQRRFHPRAQQSVVGIGSDLSIAGDGERFRAQHGIADPYVACVGRLDPHKGSDELVDMFLAYKQRNPSSLKLVLVGEPVKPIEPSDDVVVTGFVDAQTRDDAVAGAIASMHPSYFESFSMVLTEAWAQRKPAIVNGHCNVFEGQARRSGGALPYKGFAEFEAALDLVVSDGEVAKRLGEAGRSYTERRYSWDVVMDNYEYLLEHARVH